MADINLYSIKYVADRTGLKPHLIRVWETRYKVVRPRRTDGNHRLYCQTDIRRLTLLKQTVAKGHRISQLAGLSNDQLRQLLSLPTHPAAPHDVPTGTGNALRRQCWNAVRDLDPDALEEALFRAAVQLSRRALVEKVLIPLFTQIGEHWAAGRLKIINEHMATQYARGLLLDLLRNSTVSRQAPRIVLGTPVGQAHELGALCAALAACEAGWRPIYFGANLPAEELAAATARLKARTLALSITHPTQERVLHGELLNLRRYLGPGTVLMVGGRIADRLTTLLNRIEARRIRSWPDFKDALQLLADS